MRARKGGSVQNKGGCVTAVILGYELAHISFCNRDNQKIYITLCMFYLSTYATIKRTNICMKTNGNGLDIPKR